MKQKLYNTAECLRSFAAELLTAEISRGTFRLFLRLGLLFCLVMLFVVAIARADAESQGFILRMVVALLIASCGIELIVASRLVGNQRLNVLVYKSGVALLCFFGARFLASFADEYFSQDVGYFSNLVNVFFWSIVNYKFRLFRKVLSSDAVGTPGRETVAARVENLLDEMERSKQKYAEYLDENRIWL